MIEDQVKEEIKDAAINFGSLLTSWNKWPKSANWKFVGKGGKKRPQRSVLVVITVNWKEE